MDGGFWRGAVSATVPRLSARKGCPCRGCLDASDDAEQDVCGLMRHAPRGASARGAALDGHEARVTDGAEVAGEVGEHGADAPFTHFA